MRADLLPDDPSELDPEFSDPSELNDWEFPEIPCTDGDDTTWEAFVPDDDERDPHPDARDFWIDGQMQRAA